MADLRANARVTASEVKEIFDTELTDEKLQNHINTASFKVDQIAADDATLSAELLKQIELYWSAEVACAQDPRAAKEGIKSTSVTYNVTTTYGETAIDLDPTGVLADDKKGTAGFDVPNAKGTTHDYELDPSAERDS